MLDYCYILLLFLLSFIRSACPDSPPSPAPALDNLHAHRLDRSKQHGARRDQDEGRPKATTCDDSPYCGLVPCESRRTYWGSEKGGSWVMVMESGGPPLTVLMKTVLHWLKNECNKRKGSNYTQLDTYRNSVTTRRQRPTRIIFQACPQVDLLVLKFLHGECQCDDTQT